MQETLSPCCRAFQLLKDSLALEINNTPRLSADAVSTFSKAGISIAYMYSFLLGGKGILVFRTDNPELAHETILQNNLKYITETDLT